MRSKHSRRTVPTHRSAEAFARGARTGVRSTGSPPLSAIGRAHGPSPSHLVCRAPSHKTLGNVELLAEVVGEGVTGAVDDPIGHVLLGEEPPLEPKASGDLAACHFPLERGENLAKAKPGIRQETSALRA
jgi:hypothetical protein